MKKIHILIVAVMVLLVLFFAIAVSMTLSQAHDFQQLCDQLYTCISYYNRIYNNMDWALHYAQLYTEARDYDTLLKAQAACVAAKAAISAESKPLNSMSTEQYLSLLRRQIDSDVVYVLWNNLPNRCTELLAEMDSLESYLFCQVHFYEMSTPLANWIEHCRSAIQADCEYLSLVTNYLLLQLGHIPDWKTITAQNSTVFSSRDNFSQDAEALKQAYRQAEKEASNYRIGLSDLYSVFSYSDRLSTIGTSIDDQEVHLVLAPYMWSIPDVPVYYPMPEWLECRFSPENETAGFGSTGLDWEYFSEDPAIGAQVPVQTGREIQYSPSCCVVTASNVAQKSMQAYCDLLTAFDIPSQIQVDDTGRIYRLNTSSDLGYLQIEWSQTKTILSFHGTPGCLIPQLYLKALRVQ